MPNQNTQNPNPNQPIDGLNEAPFMPQSDIPPLPPEMTNPVTPPLPSTAVRTTAPEPEPTITTTPIVPATDSGSASPPTPAFSDITTPPKKKFGGGKIIATILGILVLVGGLGAGTYLIGQKQLFQQKASTPIDCDPKACPRCSCGCTSTDDCATSNACNICPSSSPVSTQAPEPTVSPTNCGKAPDPIPSFTKPGFTIPTDSLSETAKPLIVYYYKGNGIERIIKLNLNGTNKEVVVSSKGAVDTGLTIKKGDTLIVKNIIEPTVTAACAPDKSLPHKSLGWISPNSNKTCGLTLPGPPSKYEPFVPIDISSVLSQLDATGDTILSKECWADWMEWPGDYDFEDFFLAFSVKGTSVAPYCAMVNVYDTTWASITSTSLKPGETYRFSVKGSPDGSMVKARFIFTLSSGAVETKEGITTKKPDTNEYYVEYTVPENTKTLDVKAWVNDGTTWY